MQPDRPCTFNTRAWSCSLLLSPRTGQDCTEVQGKSQQTLPLVQNFHVYSPLDWEKEGRLHLLWPHLCSKPLLTSTPSQQSGCFEGLWRGSNPCPWLHVLCLLFPFYTSSPIQFLHPNLAAEMRAAAWKASWNRVDHQGSPIPKGHLHTPGTPSQQLCAVCNLSVNLSACKSSSTGDGNSEPQCCRPCPVLVPPSCLAPRSPAGCAHNEATLSWGFNHKNRKRLPPLRAAVWGTPSSPIPPQINIFFRKTQLKKTKKDKPWGN